MTRADVDRWMAELSNWGRWGKEDELGALNLITPKKRKQAAALVREGICVSLAHNAEKRKGPDNPTPFQHEWSTTNTGMSDTYSVTYHGMAHTHLDALCHMAYQGKIYNGFPFPDITEQGAHKCSVIQLKNGLFSRGVLMDIPRLRGLEYLEPGTAIYPEDLEAWLAKTGTKLGSGDILLIRTGRWARRAASGAWAESKYAGLHASCAKWLKDHNISVLGSDAASDVFPSGIDGVEAPIHQFMLVCLGVVILDNLELETLSQATQSRHRWDFLLTVAPLAVEGGTGSPVNPIATF
jgi:kynurenine formamidase